MREKKSQAMRTTTKSEPTTKPDLPAKDTMPKWLVIDDSNRKFIEKLMELKASWNFHTLLIIWNTGTGKTHVVKSIFHDRYFINEQEFKQKLTAWQLVLRPNSELTCKIEMYPLEALLKKPNAIYDDLGIAEPTAAYLEKMLFRLDRVDKDKKTIITTNLSLEQIEKRDARISSRILKDCKVIELKWPDRRKQNVQFVEL